MLLCEFDGIQHFKPIKFSPHISDEDTEINFNEQKHKDKIKNEEIVGNNATVEVEIEVLDYATSVNNSKKYFLEHESEFLKENEAQIKEDDLDKAKTYIDYKIEKLKEQKNKTKYQITFDLEKSGEVWELRNLNEIDRQKIHGLY